MISVIVPTYNGAKKIIHLLKSLEKQTFRNFEVIVVIDGSTDNTQKQLESQTFELPKFTIIFQENKGRSASRNTGANTAIADLLLFVDDDMRLSPESLDQHAKFHQEYSTTVLMGSAMEEEALMKTDLQKYRAFLSQKWTKDLQNNTQPLHSSNFFLMAAHLSIPKKLFLSFGGFDEALTDAEDYDLGKKLLEQNILIYYNYQIKGWHDDFITCRAYIRRQQAYQKAHLRLQELYPKRHEANSLKVPRGFKKWIYKFFSGNFWVNVVDTHNFLIVLPKAIRYKLYDLIIAANSVHFPLKSNG